MLDLFTLLIYQKKIVCAYNCDTVSVLRKNKIVKKDAFHISTDGGCCYTVKSVLKLDQEERDLYPDSDMN